MLAIAGLYLMAVLSGRLLAVLSKSTVRQVAGWSLTGILVWLGHRVLEDREALARMVGICVVLLGGMKATVYAEWAVGKRLTMRRYVVFAVLWFGMNPGDFVRRVSGLGWKRDLLVGVLLTITGTGLAWWVWWSGWRQVVLMFVPLSIAFHFGILRMLKAFLRLAGFPVRTLFGNVLATNGMADFWGRRWNAGYTQMMQRLVGRPVGSRWGPAAGLLAVFLVSGLLHECAITLPVQTGFGLPTAYFLLQGILTLGEKRLGRAVGAIPTLLAVGLPLGLLFPPVFRREVMERCLELFRHL